MNEVEKVNPYASPEAASDDATAARVRALAWLRGAGLGILILAVMEVTGSVIAILTQSAMLSLAAIVGIDTPNPIWMEALILVFAAVSLARGIVMVIGAREMRLGRHYRWAKVGAIVAMLGVFYPFYWIDAACGVWAFILLRREKYQEMFEIGPRAALAAFPVVEHGRA